MNTEHTEHTLCTRHGLHSGDSLKAQCFGVHPSAKFHSCQYSSFTGVLWAVGGAVLSLQETAAREKSQRQTHWLTHQVNGGCFCSESLNLRRGLHRVERCGLKREPSAASGRRGCRARAFPGKGRRAGSSQERPRAVPRLPEHPVLLYNLNFKLTAHIFAATRNFYKVKKENKI